MNLELDTHPGKELFGSTRRSKEGAIWKIIADDIGYVNMGRLEEEHIEPMMHDLEGTRTIIFDMRAYLSTSTTSSPLIRLPTSRARHSRVNSSNTTRSFTRRPFSNRSERKS